MIPRDILPFYLGVPLFIFCVALLPASALQAAKAPVDRVNPMIGTAEHRHVYPGATVPFGMAQFSPDMRDNTWDGSSGYLSGAVVRVW
jgi:putative alpha-1,2-mannosidase